MNDTITTLITPSAARAALVQDTRHYLGYACDCYDPGLWEEDVLSEALARFFGADRNEAPYAPDLPIWRDVRWCAIADRHGVAHDGTTAGARAALRDEALARTDLPLATFIAFAENAVVLFQMPASELDTATADLPHDFQPPQEWRALVETDTVPWPEIYRIREDLILPEFRVATGA